MEECVYLKWISNRSMIMILAGWCLTPNDPSQVLVSIINCYLKIVVTTQLNGEFVSDIISLYWYHTLYLYTLHSYCYFYGNGFK